MKTFFTADTHFGHKNIIKYCNRPYYDVVKMNNDIMAKWNEVVRSEDTIYHLGDFALCSFDDAKAILKKLNGRKILIKGNHDRSPRRMSEMGFDLVASEAWYNGWKLKHIPWKVGKGEQGLCGHVHEIWTRAGNLINVGIDRWRRPVTFTQLLAAKQDCFGINKLDMTPWRQGKAT